jgi:hypothetical protein
MKPIIMLLTFFLPYIYIYIYIIKASVSPSFVSLVTYLAYIFTLKLEIVRCSEMSMNLYRTTLPSHMKVAFQIKKLDFK